MAEISQLMGRPNIVADQPEVSERCVRQAHGLIEIALFAGETCSTRDSPGLPALVAELDEECVRALEVALRFVNLSRDVRDKADVQVDGGLASLFT